MKKSAYLISLLALQAFLCSSQDNSIITKINCIDVPYRDGDPAQSTKYAQTFNCFETPLAIKMISGMYGGGYSAVNMERLQVHLYHMEGKRAISDIPDRLLPTDINTCYEINPPVRSFVDFNIECKINGQKEGVELKINNMSDKGGGVFEIEAKSIITGQYIIFLVWKLPFEEEVKKPNPSSGSNKGNNGKSSNPSVGTWTQDYAFVRTISEGADGVSEFKALRKCIVYFQKDTYEWSKTFEKNEAFQLSGFTQIKASRGLE